MDILRFLPQLIDFSSFQSVWFWIALALFWSRLSHVVLGVPWDLVSRAHRSSDPQALEDVSRLAEIHSRRVLRILSSGGVLLTGLIFALPSLLLMLGFGYGLQLSQALALLLTPALLAALPGLRLAKAITTGLPPEELIRRLARQRIILQLTGMAAIFVTSLWGMYQNLSATVLGN